MTHINKEVLPRYLTRWHQYILIWKCQAWCYSNWWYPEGGRLWIFQISLICLIYLYKMTHDIPRCRIVWFLQIAYLYKMTRDIPGRQIVDFFLQIAYLPICLFVQNDPWHSWTPDRGVFAQRAAEVWSHLTAGISCWKMEAIAPSPNQTFL